MRNFLHAGLDSSGAWKEKGWKCSREPGHIGQKQHFSFLLDVNLPLYASPKQASVHAWAHGVQTAGACEKVQGVSKAWERGFNLLGCAMLGHWPSHC